eukprot:CAMPEP_0174878032 /NCGR_PEP_ID=MMETSP1114-20130205/82555_1 /TAXON_ID=312471 /ORGANISM="Neobodo designis, Strain CCAP 1951/1" /LENGTH=597 /DNA_ID=CAMNT_0016113419 /DNA_START=40 /DNA_END=1833 /DNA_ORIENTATION=-
MRVAAGGIAAALLMLAAAVSASVTAGDTPTLGNWRHPTIEGLVTNPTYDAEHTLYGAWSAANGNWTGLSWTAADGLTPVVHVSRNKNVEAWDYVKFENLNATDAYYTAGYAEGYLTFDTIHLTYVNQIKGNVEALDASAPATAFMNAHIAYEQQHEAETPFGAQLANQMRQIDGMYDGYVAGYNAAGRPTNITQMTWRLIYLISYNQELDNVLAKFSSERRRSQNIVNSPDMHCSALLKLTSDDLFFAHDTWTGFNAMIRQFKTYVLPPGTVVMSSYPGVISSIDDWYMTGHGLAVMETTNGFTNASLYDFILPTQVSEFNRAMIGNYIAETPLEWMNIFNTSNSGTYNNQYMVANMRAARSALQGGSALPTGTFYVGEQIPGTIVFEDQTEFLNTNKHWPSFNIPYYRKIQILSGYDALQAPQYFGIKNYETYSRSVIFRRMQSTVHDTASMYYLMRYNDFERDPASTLPWCQTAWNPSGVEDCGNNTQGSAQTIASRYDLNTPQPSPDGDYVGTMRVPFGAVDTKVTSAAMMDGALTAVAINGPTRVQQPTWDYDAFIAKHPQWKARPYIGLPSRYDFEAVLFGNNNATTPAPNV